MWLNINRDGDKKDMAPKRGLVLNPKDNVANTFEEVLNGEEITARKGNEDVFIQVVERIPFGFKVALSDIAQGEPVFKYGEIIGRASQPIRKGALVHIHNLEGTRGRGDLHRS